MIKSIKKIKFGLLFLLFSFTMPHDYFVSITSINFDEKEKEINTTVRFIAHDLEKELIAEYGIDLNLGGKTEFKQKDSLVEIYLKDHLEIVVDDRPLQLEILGSEFLLDESFYVYLVANYESEPTKISVQNDLLTETFPKQENITYINLWDRQESKSFGKQNTSYTFKK